MGNRSEGSNPSFCAKKRTGKNLSVFWRKVSSEKPRIIEGSRERQNANRCDKVRTFVCREALPTGQNASFCIFNFKKTGNNLSVFWRKGSSEIPLPTAQRVVFLCENRLFYDC